jgi:hypothetical protein
MKETLKNLAELDTLGELKMLENELRTQILNQVEFSSDPRMQRDELQASTRFFSILREIIQKGLNDA